jgi:hypothetical protein
MLGNGAVSLAMGHAWASGTLAHSKMRPIFQLVKAARFMRVNVGVRACLSPTAQGKEGIIMAAVCLLWRSDEPLRDSKGIKKAIRQRAPGRDKAHGISDRFACHAGSAKVYSREAAMMSRAHAAIQKDEAH